MNLPAIRTTAWLATAAILAIFITRPGVAQEPVKKEYKKKVVMKVITDDNGTRTIIDTTMVMPDSAWCDSLHREIDRVFRPGRGGMPHRFRFHCNPGDFSCDFDMPSLRESMKQLEQLKDFEWEENLSDTESSEQDYYDFPSPMPERRLLRRAERGQTLSDMIGDIPMDRITGYKIKDRKHGRRIIIDLEDGPVFGRGDQKVIIIREPGKVKRVKMNPHKRVKLNVSPGGEAESQIESVPDTPDVPPPPPPPPPAPKENQKEPQI